MQKIISPVLICGLVEMVSWSAVCAPYWFEGKGVILEQEVCSTTPIKFESYLITGGSKPKLFKGKKCYFFGHLVYIHLNVAYLPRDVYMFSLIKNLFSKIKISFMETP